jgi:hypothetical protein
MLESAPESESTRAGMPALRFQQGKLVEMIMGLPDKEAAPRSAVLSE